jgi:hypothetical protein
MGFESGGQNSAEFLLTESQRGKGRSLLGGMGQSVQAYGVRGAEHFELKRTRLDIETPLGRGQPGLCRFETKYSHSSWLLS